LRHARPETALPENLPCAASPDSAVRGEQRESIRKAFYELPAKYRLVATLALVEEETYSDIAQAVGISESLVKVRVFRAVRMLRKNLSSLGVEVSVK
jgi:RNA polymerase sigma factor (sigma-70 family)